MGVILRLVFVSYLGDRFLQRDGLLIGMIGACK